MGNGNRDPTASVSSWERTSFFRPSDWSTGEVYKVNRNVDFGWMAVVEEMGGKGECEADLLFPTLDLDLKVHLLCGS